MARITSDDLKEWSILNICLQSDKINSYFSDELGIVVYFLKSEYIGAKLPPTFKSYCERLS